MSENIDALQTKTSHNGSPSVAGSEAGVGHGHCQKVGSGVRKSLKVLTVEV